MAIPWLVLLQNVPWTEVLRTAPKVVDGARKLWDSVARKPESPPAPLLTNQTVNSAEATAVAKLEARAVALESTVAELHRQMHDSSALIKALADQNEQLIRRVEAHRKRIGWLIAAIVVVAVLAVTGPLLLYFRIGA